MPERTEPLIDRLGRFSPTAAGLDRDAILFAAGTRSARGSSIWKPLAALLLVSQVATLVLLWPERPQQVVGEPPAILDAPRPELVLPPPTSSPEVWSAGSRPDVVLRPGQPDDSEVYVSSGPTLTIRDGHRID